MKVIIAGGGTGGHLFPGVAVGEEMRRQRPDVELLFVGTSAGFEAKWLPQSGLPHELFPMHGVHGRGASSPLRGVVGFARSLGMARLVIRRFRPDVVLCVGGYASAPIGVAAILARVPIVLQEANTRLGLTNRILWRFARRICVAFEQTAQQFSSTKVTVTGNPSRFRFDPSWLRAPGEELQILVLGGSTGAHRLNLGVLAAFKIWGNSVIKLVVTHQTGEADEGLVKAGYDQIGLHAQVTPFIGDMPRALHAAHLIVARAGGNTVYEVALAARPAIFVPYPFHSDMQQLHNARVLESVGGAVVINDDADLAKNLIEHLRRLSAEPDKLAAMGERAHSIAKPDAAARIARVCFDSAEGKAA